MRILFYLLSFLPLIVLHALGAVLGVLTWMVSPTYRRHMAEHMTLALGEQGAKALRLRAMMEAGRLALELPKIWRSSQQEIAAYVRSVEGWSLVEKMQQEGKRALLLTPHLGCFEVCGPFLTAHFPLTALYKPPKQAWLEGLAKQGRTHPQLTMAPANMAGVRVLLKAFKKGQAIGLLPDQVPGAGEGRWLDFFGRPAYTMTLAARLCEGDVAVLLAFAKRMPYGQGYRLIFSDITAALHGNVEARAQCINHEIERLILRNPAQYLWGYNRYKCPRGVTPPCREEAQKEAEKA